jgi:hypothetical protein
MAKRKPRHNQEKAAICRVCQQPFTAWREGPSAHWTEICGTKCQRIHTQKAWQDNAQKIDARHARKYDRTRKAYFPNKKF